MTQHRKTSVSFRDTCLFDIFTTSLLTLQSLRADPSKGASRLCEQGLALALNCLPPAQWEADGSVATALHGQGPKSCCRQPYRFRAMVTCWAGARTFDFVGIFPDDSSDDVGTVQIPNSWRAAVVDPNTLQLFWDLYALLPCPRSTGRGPAHCVDISRRVEGWRAMNEFDLEISALVCKRGLTHRGGINILPTSVLKKDTGGSLGVFILGEARHIHNLVQIPPLRPMPITGQKNEVPPEGG